MSFYHGLRSCTGNSTTTLYLSNIEYSNIQDFDYYAVILRGFKANYEDDYTKLKKLSVEASFSTGAGIIAAPADNELELTISTIIEGSSSPSFSCEIPYTIVGFKANDVGYAAIKEEMEITAAGSISSSARSGNIIGGGGSFDSDDELVGGVRGFIIENTDIARKVNQLSFYISEPEFYDSYTKATIATTANFNINDSSPHIDLTVLATVFVFPDTTTVYTKQDATVTGENGGTGNVTTCAYSGSTKAVECSDEESEPEEAAEDSTSSTPSREDATGAASSSSEASTKPGMEAPERQTR